MAVLLGRTHRELLLILMGVLLKRSRCNKLRKQAHTLTRVSKQSPNALPGVVTPACHPALLTVDLNYSTFIKGLFIMCNDAAVVRSEPLFSRRLLFHLMGYIINLST